MEVSDFGGPRITPTPDEVRFLDALGGRSDLHFDVRLHEDSGGTPWMIVSLDFVEGAVIRRTLRLDFDGKAIMGGWSPASLNWDDGVRAEVAGVDTAPPDGIYVEGESVEALAEAAAAWFRMQHSAG